MGPMATVDFLQRLYRQSSGARDQDQIPLLACIASTIPDRSTFLLGNGADPYPEMLRGMNWLRQGGASAVAIPCNTAHYWAEELERDSGLPVVHIVGAVADYLSRAHDPPRSVGLMATRGTLKANLYSAQLAALGIRCLAPDAQTQGDIDAAIDLVKAGRQTEAESFALAAERALIDQGVDALILACTELPLALTCAPPAVQPPVDSTEQLVAACIRRFSEGRQGEPHF